MTTKVEMKLGEKALEVEGDEQFVAESTKKFRDAVLQPIDDHRRDELRILRLLASGAMGIRVLCENEVMVFPHRRHPLFVNKELLCSLVKQGFAYRMDTHGMQLFRVTNAGLDAAREAKTDE